MAEIFNEGNLRFVFTDEWRVTSGDKNQFFQTHLMPLQATKAVDFVGLHSRHGLYLIEVKDFRGRRIELKNREKVSEGDTIFHQTARKVKDTLATIVGASRNASEPLWNDLFLELHSGRRLTVIVWLEFDEGPPSTRQKRAILRKMRQQADTRRQEFKRRLSWLTNSVDVLNQQIAPDRLPGVTVVNIGRAGRS